MSSSETRGRPKKRARAARMTPARTEDVPRPEPLGTAHSSVISSPAPKPSRTSGSEASRAVAPSSPMRHSAAFGRAKGDTGSR